MKRPKSYDRRSFLRLGMGVAAGTSMAASLGGSEVLAAGASPPAPLLPANSLSDGLPDGEDSLTPQSPSPTNSGKVMHPLGIFLANHDQDSGMHLWKLERWKREISYLKRMGADTLWFLPMEFGQHSSSDFEDMAPYWALQRAICRAIVETGLGVGIYVGLNDVCLDTWNKHPEWHAVKGNYLLEPGEVCPSVPEALKEILKLRKKLFAGLPTLDYVQVEITDYGGCSCDMCAPYPKTYMKVLEQFAELCRHYHPRVKVVASGIGVNLTEEDMLRQGLRSASWVDYVWEVPRGPKPVIKGVFEPNFTALNHWGRLGSCPVFGIIQHALEGEYQRAVGIVQYSEGIHDDANRFALLQFAQDPQRSLDDVARAYAKDWLGLSGRDETVVGQMIAGLGCATGDAEINMARFNLSSDCGAEGFQADDRLRILIDLHGRTPGVKDNYRYWLLHYGAVCESFSTVKGSLSLEALRRETDTARDAFLRLAPEYAQSLPSRAPGLPPLYWPRGFSAAWKREISFTGESQ